MLHYAVIGDPVAHSLSPEIYFRLFAQYGIVADFSCLRITAGMLPNVRELTSFLSGFAVTMPHKRSIIEYIDVLDDTSLKCGAVNIVKRTSKGLIGFNTDGDGLADALSDMGFDPEGASAAILGRGGAALSAAAALEARGAHVVLLVRSPGKKLAFPQAQVTEFHSECDLFINATPLGMSNEKSFEDAALIERLSPKLVFDMVYSRAGETQLVRIARELGISTSDGYPMLYRQALRAFDIWFGDRSNHAMPMAESMFLM